MIPRPWQCLLAAVTLSALAHCAASAQEQPKPLVRWEFKADADGWYPAHSMGPPAVRDGVLHGKVTGGDPYMICSEGQCFDIQANDYQAVVIRAKVKDGGGAEFFWASSTQGKDLGFVAGKEIGFSMIADGEFHTYHVFPLWKDRVTRLRFDPPGGEGQEVWIDYIAVVEFPQPDSVPQQPVWEFDRGLDGFIPQSDIETFEARDGQLVVTSLAGQRPTLLSPQLDGDPGLLRYLTIRAALQGVEQIIVAFAEENAKFGGRQQLAVPAVADGEMKTYLIDVPDLVGDAARISRLRLSFTTSAQPATVSVDSVALTAAPSGPPELALSITPETPILFVGRPREFTVALQNVGGESVGPVEIAVSSPAIGGEAPTVRGPASLAPGEKWTGSVPIVASLAGRAPLTVRVTAPAAPAVTVETNLVVSRGVDLSRLPRPTDARAVEIEEGIWISNQVVGLMIIRNEQGCGPALLCVWDGAWKPMATIASFCELIGMGGDPPQARIRLTPVLPLVAVQGGTAFGVEMRGRVVSGEAQGDLKIFIRLDRDEALPEFAVTSIFMPSQPGELLRVAGPKFLAGDGTFDGEQAEGLFAGLEWLVEGEKSSSTLDIAPPGNVRFAPHPNRITMPLMAIGAPEGGVVGMMWDVTQKWDGEHDRPTAVFASPNFLDNQDNHLMQLFAPSIPEWTDENHLVADRPYELQPGKPLTIKQRIFAMPRGSVRDAVRLWYERYGTPPLPELPRSYEDTIALSIRSYEEVLYVDDKGWMGVQGWAPGRSPGVALHYILAAQVLGGDAPYPDLKEKALDRIGSQRDLNLAAHIGGISEPLLDLRGRAYSIMSSQDEKGGWYFKPDEEHRPLGEPGRTTLGTVAGNVNLLLRAARIFHDERLLAAGLKGLEFMEQFKVPRGAQVWEVPLHTPDILAAAHGVDACLAGYLATGNETHLRRAVYWAESGLPFLYTWQAPEEGLEAMRYGSIPVFGATWYVGSWFGRLVQWNGLAYASSLQRLAEYDKTYDWRHIAEGVTRSGIIQQRLEPDYLGLYPDSVGMIDGSVSWGLMLGPQGILNNVFPLIGRDLEPHTETPKLNGTPVTLLAAGQLSGVRCDADSVSFLLRYPAGEWMYATLVGVAGPGQVVADATNVARVEQFAAQPGYRYDPVLGVVEIKLRRADAPVAVTIRGVTAFRGEGARTAWDFETGAQGWHAMHSMTPIEVENGIAATSITGDDPYMGVVGLDASTEEFGGLRVRMRAQRSGPASIYFAAGGQPFAADAQQGFAVTAGDFQEYAVDLRAHPRWRGLVTAIRIDPPGSPGDAIELDSVAFIRRADLE
ncbi:MAG: hypothetical protein JSV65_09470 [Armatimonadota bacterium]|nr:MAG: hypothetical protein JSV65_09470 [Armatimonadota bacterium]